MVPTQRAPNRPTHARPNHRQQPSKVRVNHHRRHSPPCAIYRNSNSIGRTRFRRKKSRSTFENFNNQATQTSPEQSSTCSSSRVRCADHHATIPRCAVARNAIWFPNVESVHKHRSAQRTLHCARRGIVIDRAPVSAQSTSVQSHRCNPLRCIDSITTAATRR